MLRYGRKVFSFDNDRDIFKAVKDRATSLKEVYLVRFVTPIRCFTKAKLNIRTVNNKIENVYVLSDSLLVRNLISFFLHLFNGTYSYSRLDTPAKF